jgi:hypothetical protein
MPSAHLLDLALRAASVLGSFAGAGKGSRDARCHTPMPRMQPSRGKVWDAVPMLEAQEPSLRTDVARQVGAGEVALDLPTPDGGERDHGAARSGCPQRDLAQGARHTETARGRAGRDGSGDRNAAAVADGGHRAGSDRAAEFSRVQSPTFGAECPPIGARVPATRWHQMGRSRDDVTGDEHEQRRAKRREDGCANPSAILSERL